jgi:hypothetical protein
VPNPVAVDRQRMLDVSYSAYALDLDRDKRFDCVISVGDKRSDDVRTQILVFLERAVRPGDDPLFGKGGTPAQVLVLDGFARPLEIVDVDGDGLPDLVAGAIRPNLIDGIRAAASERIDAELYVYLNTKSGFSKRPDLSTKLSIQAGGLDFTARSSANSRETAFGVPRARGQGQGARTSSRSRGTASSSGPRRSSRW